MFKPVASPAASRDHRSVRHSTFLTQGQRDPREDDALSQDSRVRVYRLPLAVARRPGNVPAVGLVVSGRKGVGLMVAGCGAATCSAFAIPAFRARG